MLLNSYYQLESNYYSRRGSTSHDYLYPLRCEALVGVGIPSRATYSVGGASGYMYVIFYPLIIRF